MDSAPARLERVIDETPVDRTLVFQVPPPGAEAFRFRPGQYVTFHDVLDGKPVVRSYSISSAPAEPGRFEVTVRRAGAYGTRLYHLATGTTLTAHPPRGSFVLDVKPGQTLVLSAGGSGVAPYRGFVRALVAAGHSDPVTVLHSVKEPGELVFRAEFEATARTSPWFHYLPTVTRLPDGTPWSGRRGRVDAACLRALWTDPARAIVQSARRQASPTRTCDARSGASAANLRVECGARAARRAAKERGSRGRGSSRACRSKPGADVGVRGSTGSSAGAGLRSKGGADPPGRRGEQREERHEQQAPQQVQGLGGSRELGGHVPSLPAHGGRLLAA
jgi:ferredoxin-NADP reductase